MINFFLGFITIITVIVKVSLPIITYHLLPHVYTLDKVEDGAVIPVHQKAAGVIDSVDRSKSANRRCLLVIHLEKLHTSTVWVLLAQALDLFITRESHQQAPPFLHRT